MDSTLANQVATTQRPGTPEGRRAMVANGSQGARSHTDGQAERLAEKQIDRELVERFKSGQRRAFNELVRRHQKSVYYMSLRYVKNDADAADVTQKAFVRAYKAIDTFRGDSSFKTWITRIAINQAINYLRDNKRERATDLDDLRDDALVRNPTGAHRVIRSEESAALRDAIDTLPTKQRMILQLRIYEELPFREIARLVDSSENSTKVSFHHAVKKLRAKLGDAQVAAGAARGEEKKR